MTTRPFANPLPLANQTFFRFKTIEVGKGIYNVDVTEVQKEVQPLGGDGYGADGYPVPFVQKIVNGVATIKYHGVGMGDLPWKLEAYTTREAARKAALEWLGDAKEATEADKAAYEAKQKQEIVNEKRKYLKELKVRVAEVEKELAKLEA